MKTPKKLFMFMAVFCLCFYCCEFDGSNDDIIPHNDVKRSDSLYKSETFAFKAEFQGVYLSNFSVPEGIEAHSILEIVNWSPRPSLNLSIDSQQGITSLGNFTIHLNFCFTKPEPCPLGSIKSDANGIAGKDIDLIKYPVSIYGYMAGTNGDTLFISCSGVIVEGREENHPSDVVAYWKEPFSFTGGTGRFEGATGGGLTNDYNSCSDYCTHHQWEGTLTIVKEQKSIRPVKVRI